MIKTIASLCLVFISSGFVQGRAQTMPLTVSVDLSQPGKKISPDLIGIFFEDINYAADGGLYAELVQNRSFEYSPVERMDWGPLTAWEEVARDGARGSLKIADAVPVHSNNPRYVVVETQQTGGGFGLMNSGFDGITVRAGEQYDFSVFARQLFTGNRWGGSGRLEFPARLVIRLESKSGELLAENAVAISGREWERLDASLSPAKSDDAARLVLLAPTRGAIALDMVSLFPRKTFKNRPNGLRADLAQTIADLKPKFMRFPGGCLVHGYGLGNMYRWQDTIGPVEQRRAMPNIWGYHQTLGLGYFEYFQFCEDIGAMPLPVVAAGVCCQNADHQGGTGQRGLPLDEMPAYIQEVLDLIEWANGPTNSTWGAKRAAAGHPEPFKLKYLGVGNEDHITPVFKERFLMIHDAIKAKHPEIIVIGTTGPFHSGEDYEKGWEIAREHSLEMVDEHYYEKPEWFLNNLHRYDSYDRAGTKVYLGEYAAHDAQRQTTLRSALAEAAYLTHLERNADVVPLASYAPLLGKIGRTQWNPNLIYFNNTRIVPTINYHVQQLFSLNSGDTYLSSQVSERIEAGRAEPSKTGVFLGTWNSQAEYDDVRVTSGTATLIQEDFEAPANNWRTEAGSWTVSDGAYRQSGNNQPAVSRLPATIDQTNYTVTVRARKTGGAEGFLIGFGAVDAGNYYWWNLGGWGNTEHAVQKGIGGDRQTIGRSVPGRIESDRWYDIKIEVAGSRIKCHLDGALVHDFTDTASRTPEVFAVSSVRDSRTGDVILKLVNADSVSKALNMELRGATSLAPTATKTVLAGDSMAVNRFEGGDHLLPATSTITVGKSFNYEAPAHSLTVIRIKTR